MGQRMAKEVPGAVGPGRMVFSRSLHRTVLRSSVNGPPRGCAVNTGRAAHTDGSGRCSGAQEKDRAWGRPLLWGEAGGGHMCTD